MSRLGDWIQTYTGRQFWPTDPRPEEVFIDDIAHSLSMQCRFSGHCREFYSVAQHSVFVSQQVAPEHALWGLLHDAAEAYLVDLPRPIKRFSRLGEHYQAIEAQVMSAICTRFNLPSVEPASVKVADDRLLATEMRDVMAPAPEPWANAAEPLAAWIADCWSPRDAERAFLTRFAELTAGRK